VIAIRLVGSALFYLAFYSGSVLFVLAALFALPFSQEAMRRSCDNWSRYHRLCARLLLGITVRLEGELPRQGALIALRHESFFEAIDLPALLTRPAVFAKAELLRIPLWGRIGAAYGLVAVERDQGASALRAMIAAARRHEREGRVLAIFPEGTRVPHGQDHPIQSGFSGLYKLLGLPVVPVAVDSGPLYHRWIKRPGVVTYRVGAAIAPGLPREEIEARVDEAITALNGHASKNAA
jgi:1-acyl-sn-glycerol-3-phosphate acyltransferase